MWFLFFVAVSDDDEMIFEEFIIALSLKLRKLLDHFLHSLFYNVRS